MADGFKVLDQRIAVLRGLSRFGEETAHDVAKIIRDDIAQSVRDGEDPDGKAWERRRADGAKPLQNAMDGIRMTVLGKTITARITKRHLVLHHFGYSRGNVQRKILPPTLTKRMAAKLRAYYDRKLSAELEGKS